MRGRGGPDALPRRRQRPHDQLPPPPGALNAVRGVSAGCRLPSPPPVRVSKATAVCSGLSSASQKLLSPPFLRPRLKSGCRHLEERPPPLACPPPALASKGRAPRRRPAAALRRRCAGGGFTPTLQACLDDPRAPAARAAIGGVHRARGCPPPPPLPSRRCRNPLSRTRCAAIEPAAVASARGCPPPLHPRYFPQDSRVSARGAEIDLRTR